VDSGIFIPKDVKPYPKDHELLSARALAKAGHYVVFLQPDNHKGVKTADVLLDGIPYEIKAPTGSLKSIERSLKRASKQSLFIVFDCRRMRINNQQAIQRELENHLRKQVLIKSLFFINKYGNVVDLSKSRRYHKNAKGVQRCRMHGSYVLSLLCRYSTRHL